MNQDKEKIRCKKCGIDFISDSDEGTEEELCYMCIRLKRSSIQPKHYPQSEYEGH